MTIEKLIRAMIRFDRGDAARIQHFIKVHSFARLIGVMEGLDSETLFTLEAAAVVHDIAIVPCEKKFGRSDGAIQEREGPAYARAMLAELGFDEAVIQRVCFLVGHHHTYVGIDAPDWQILVEADFLVNLFEGGESNARGVLERVFKTEAGRALLIDQFALD